MLKIGEKRTDITREVEGVWAYFGQTSIGYVWWLDGETSPLQEGEPKARVKVARSGNPRSREMRTQLLRAHRRVIRQMGELPDEIAQKVLREVMAHTILMDWDEVAIDDSGAVEYSPERGMKMLKADEEFRDMVLDISGTVQIYRDEEMGEEAEELGNSSSGISSGVPTSVS